MALALEKQNEEDFCMTKVWVTTQFEGLHFWAEAPSEVYFLRYPHRHIFHVKATVETNEDRQVEFFILKNKVDQIICDMLKFPDIAKGGFTAHIPLSCEKMAEHIFLELKKLGYNVCEVEVNEDSECGSTYYE